MTQQRNLQPPGQGRSQADMQSTGSTSPRGEIYRSGGGVSLIKPSADAREASQPRPGSASPQQSLAVNPSHPVSHLLSGAESATASPTFQSGKTPLAQVFKAGLRLLSRPPLPANLAAPDSQMSNKLTNPN